MTEHVRGPTYARRDTPRFEYKPSATGYTGGGYPRVRSCERRDHTPGDGTDDVFVSIHRLAAVAWHLPDGTLGRDVFLSDLDGFDVHHTQPDADKRGMPAANGEAWTELVSHGRHSEITQTQRRAWAEDKKEQVTGQQTLSEPETCERCGKADAEASVAGEDRELCIPCASAVAEASGATVEL
jgi:hypothetical protein